MTEDKWVRAMVGLLWAGLMTWTAVGCGGSGPTDRRTEFEALLANGEYDEVRARVEVYLESGEQDAWIHMASGLANLRDDADKPAARDFAYAVSLDSTLAPEVAETYRAKAIYDHENEWKERARKRMREAFRYMPSISLEPLTDPVADYLYKIDKDHEGAYQLYKELVTREDAPAKKKKEWKFRWGHSQERLGHVEEALDTYRDYREIFPKDTVFMKYVVWRMMVVLQEQALKAKEAGEYDEALALLDESFMDLWFLEKQMEGWYLAGQIEEDRGRPDFALSWYKRVSREGRRFGGEVVRNAKNRIDAINAQGVH